MRRFALVLGLAFAVACKGTEPEPTVAGSWRGVVGPQVLMMTLVVNGGVVDGSGTLSTDTDPFALTIHGTVSSGTISVSMTSGLHPAVNLTGTATKDRIEATLNGSGFFGDPITLTRWVP